MIKRALLSVSDKTGIVDLAATLQKYGVEIISTGGTFRLLKENGINVKSVESVTEFPECFNGRVKTLHPKIEGGILADKTNEEHLKEAQKLSIPLIDLVVVNLYPFKETILKSGSSINDAVENIDIGGVTLIRAAAKNFKNVILVTDKKDYSIISECIINNSKPSEELIKKFAVKGFKHTAIYDSYISNYFAEKFSEKDDFPNDLILHYEKKQNLRYGENPHQNAAYYKDFFNNSENSLVNAEQLNGKELSFNNINDANAAVDIVSEFSEPTAAAVKHCNPCGAASGSTIYEAFNKAYEADPQSIFGGIVALNRKVDLKTAEVLKKIFLEIIIAPDFEENALKLLKKKKNLRILKLNPEKENDRFDIKSVSGGLLLQNKDNDVYLDKNLKIVTEKKPSDNELDDMIFAWKIVKHVRSNAIVIAKNRMTLGIGGGQTSRIWAAEISKDHCKKDTQGAVLASDGFFPFDDTVSYASEIGVQAIIQPGGSRNDQDSIDKANEKNISMILTGMRHFKH